MPFDRESGQIYNETFTAVIKKDEDHLVYIDKPGHARERPKNHPSRKGTRTLYRMAMLKILRSLDELYPDLLKEYPLPILEYIWKAINKEGLAGLRMWKLFAPVHMTDRRLEKRPQSTFDHAIGQGSSIDCSWLTDLTLDGLALTMAEYVHVSSMPNLTSLAVVARSKQDTGFSDRVIRAWASDAKTGSLERLQHMFVGGHRYVTEQSLAHLDSFKVLDIICAHNCGFYEFSSANTKEGASSRLTSEGWLDPPK